MKPYQISHEQLAITDIWVLYSQMIFVVFGIHFVGELRSIPSTSWMFMHHPEDFKEASWADIFSFLWGLHTGIPPLLSGLELVCVKFTGTADLVTIYLYRAGLIGVYCLAMLMARNTHFRYGLSVVTSSVFLYSTVLIHPGIPLGYDVFFPVFFLLFATFLQVACHRNEQIDGVSPAIMAGFFISMTELSRPFVVYWMPVLLFMSWRMLRGQRKSWWGFLAPIILISGFWHVHLYVTFKQITFTNHSGVNLSRGWPQISYPPRINETAGITVKPGRWFDRNTEVHTLNSRILEREVFKYWMGHPVASARHMLVRLKTLLSARTQLYSHDPHSWIFQFYGPLVWLTSAIMLGSLFFHGWMLWTRKEGIDWKHDGSDVIVTGFALYCLSILAIGEAGEEARLLISVLPFLALCPIPSKRLTARDH